MNYRSRSASFVRQPSASIPRVVIEDILFLQMPTSSVVSPPVRCTDHVGQCRLNPMEGANMQQVDLFSVPSDNTSSDLPEVDIAPVDIKRDLQEILERHDSPVRGIVQHPPDSRLGS